MGNRAVITFQYGNLEKLDETQVGIYLHWNGGIESIEGFCMAASRLNISEPARFIQMLGNWFEGHRDVCVNTLDELDCDNYDNGVYVLNRCINTKHWYIARRFHVPDHLGNGFDVKLSNHDTVAMGVANTCYTSSCNFFEEDKLVSL